MAVYANEKSGSTNKKLIRFHLGFVLTNMATATLHATHGSTTYPYSLESIDTSKTYVDHAKTASTFNRPGTWKWYIECNSSDGQRLAAGGEFEVKSQ